MILSPIAPPELKRILSAFLEGLSGAPRAAAAFSRIAATWPVKLGTEDSPAQRLRAMALAQAFGIATLDEEPQRAFSWDGKVIRWRTEASVTVHEVAHWLLCPPERRHLPDFGLGAGPETGLREIADAALAVSSSEREHEEVLTSLLGILWEAELGLPAILAFLEQNWLEGPERSSTRNFFVSHLEELYQRALVDTEGRPVPPQNSPPPAPQGETAAK